MASHGHDSSDMRRGVYRRIYAGFIRGRRINSIPLESEAWFWRFNAVTDDYGNAEAEPNLLYANTVGRRANVSMDDVLKHYASCVGCGLLQPYEIDGEQFYHVRDFTTIQPAGKNGTRVRRFKESPWESEIIPNNPSDTITITSTTTNTTTKNSASLVSAGADAVAQSARGSEQPATVVGTSNQPRQASTDPGPGDGKPTGNRQVPTKNRAPNPELPPGLEKFWAAYPRQGRERSSREKCRQQWEKLRLEPIAGDVLSALDAWKKCEKWQKDGGQYVNGAHTWLKDKLYLDPPEIVCSDTAPVRPSRQQIAQVMGMDGTP